MTEIATDKDYFKAANQYLDWASSEIDDMDQIPNGQQIVDRSLETMQALLMKTSASQDYKEKIKDLISTLVSNGYTDEDFDNLGYAIANAEWDTIGK